MRARYVAYCSCLVAALGLTTAAFALAPNDGCATPTPISGPGPFPFDLTQATTGTQGQANQACNQNGTSGITNDLWFCYTPSCSGLVQVSTCGQTQVDTKIAFYYFSGCACPTAQTQALCCDDDSCGLQSTFTCEVTCGVPVLIQIGNKPGAPPGTGTFTVQCLGQPCDCDQCCGTRPNFLGTAGFTSDVASMTIQAWAGGPVLKYFDIGAPQPATGSMVNWYAPVYAPTGPQNWSQPNLGTVFGITLDASGNTYLTHASLYSGDVIGTIAGGAAGAIYKIDTNTGVPSTFAVLPNNFVTGCAYTSDCHPGLGNIAYSCAHQNLYVSNHEDGRIYRLNTAGTILSTWKHATSTAAAYSGPDPFDTNGFSPLTPHPTTQRGQRVWGLRVSNGRLYYSVWREDAGRPDPARTNEIWSVGLLPSGDFVAGSEILELQMPPWPGGGNYSNPVSDISFKPGTCCMLLAERSMWDDTFSGAHDARVLEYCKVNGVWTPSGNTFDIGASLLDSSAGGIDYDFHTGAGVNVNVWVTGDAIKLGEPPATDPYIYGLGGMTFAGTNPYANGLMIDSNQLTNQGDKTQQGDVEVSCPSGGPPPTCQVSPDHRSCVNACQLPGYFCVPVEITTYPGGGWAVTRCDCLPDGHCHIEFDVLVGPTCVGVCPNGQPCNLLATANTDGSTTYVCSCDPPPTPCQPDPSGMACTGTCNPPQPGMQCVPVEITVDMNGNWSVTACDCLPDGQCHVDFVAAAGIVCVQNCLVNPALQCKLRARGNLDGSISYRCYCDDITTNCGPVSYCNPNQPGTCLPACSGDCPPGFVCVPTEVREYPLGSGNYSITECTCVPLDNQPCRPIVENGLLRCKGTCASNNRCRLIRTLEPIVPPIEHQGARYRCECNCARPPLTMTAWWPMADATGATVRDIASFPNNGTPLPAGSTPTSVAACVGNGLSFDGVNDWVRVPDQAELDFGTGPFTIDAWIKTTASSGLQVILDKRNPANIQGYTVFLGNGQLALQMGHGGNVFANFVHPTNIADGNCHHIAVVVRRGIGSTVELWVDGGPPTTLPNNTITGSLDNAVDLFFGKRQPIPSEIFYNGVIDEVEFFKRALSADEIKSLYGAGPFGKCRETAYAPQVVFCRDDAVKTVCFTLCNYNTTSQTYNWNLFGPVGGAGCTYLGPLNFTPSSGTTTVPAGTCVSVCVTLARPGGLVNPPPVLTTCYQLNVANTGTGNTFGAGGQITSTPKWCNIFPHDDTGVPVTGRVGTVRPIIIEGTNEDDLDNTLDITVRVVVPDNDQPDRDYLKLNGLPPGEPVIGTLIAPPGGTSNVTIDCEVLQNEPFNMLEFIVEGDADNDGVPEVLSRFPFRTLIPCATEQLGDIDGDGTHDPDDNFRFIAAMLDQPLDPYDSVLSDVNCDGHTDADDIQPFVTAYINGP